MFLFVRWVFLWGLEDLYLRWFRHHWLEYTIQLSPESLIQPLGYFYLCLEKIWGESSETLDYLTMYLLATFRGFKGYHLFINLLHQDWAQDLMLFLVHIVDLHGIVPVGITFEKDVEQIQAKHLPLLGS